MNIFVFVSYGAVLVRRAETQDDHKAIVAEIRDMVNGWDIDKHVAKCEAIVREIPWDFQQSKHAIHKLLGAVGIGTHESFEHGTGFNVVTGCE